MNGDTNLRLEPDWVGTIDVMFASSQFRASGGDAETQRAAFRFHHFLRSNLRASSRGTLPVNMINRDRQMLKGWHVLQVRDTMTTCHGE